MNKFLENNKKFWLENNNHGEKLIPLGMGIPTGILLPGFWIPAIITTMYITYLMQKEKDK